MEEGQRVQVQSKDHQIVIGAQRVGNEGERRKGAHQRNPARSVDGHAPLHNEGAARRSEELDHRHGDERRCISSAGAATVHSTAHAQGFKHP